MAFMAGGSPVDSLDPACRLCLDSSRLRDACVGVRGCRTPFACDSRTDGGAIGCAIIAMITRTALGHTGHALVAGRSEIASYWLMIIAALLRVFGPWFAGGATGAWIDAAGACWCAALVLYLIKYVPYLTAPRVDGKAG